MPALGHDDDLAARVGEDALRGHQPVAAQLGEQVDRARSRRCPSARRRRSSRSRQPSPSRMRTARSRRRRPASRRRPAAFERRAGRALTPRRCGRRRRRRPRCSCRCRRASHVRPRPSRPMATRSAATSAPTWLATSGAPQTRRLRMDPQPELVAARRRARSSARWPASSSSSIARLVRPLADRRDVEAEEEVAHRRVADHDRLVDVARGRCRGARERARAPG